MWDICLVGYQKGQKKKKRKTHIKLQKKLDSNVKKINNFNQPPVYVGQLVSFTGKKSAELKNNICLVSLNVGTGMTKTADVFSDMVSSFKDFLAILHVIILRFYFEG